MCGRYYVDDETAREIEKLVWQINAGKKQEALKAAGRITAGDIYPGKDAPVLFMAGFSRRYEDGEHFVILTTAANFSMEPVYDRMPLILEKEEIAEWVLDDTKTEGILHQIPGLLERKTDYEQMSLF